MENRKIRYQLDRLPMILFLASFAITVVAGKLKTNDGDQVLFKIGKPLTISCTPEDGGDKVVTWSKFVQDDNDRNVKKNILEISSLKGRFEILKKEHMFVIEKALESDAGNYTCELDGDALTFKAMAAIVVKVPDNVYAVEEESVEINCLVKGSNPTIRWEYRSENGNETRVLETDDDRILLREFDDVEYAQLFIQSPKLSDRGIYTCIGYNELMSSDKDWARSESLLRVKGKLAALWPFLGIVAEVFVLCAIILIYEKRRNKTDLDESDTDQSPDHHKK